MTEPLPEQEPTNYAGCRIYPAYTTGVMDARESRLPTPESGKLKCSCCRLVRTHRRMRKLHGLWLCRPCYVENGGT